MAAAYDIIGDVHGQADRLEALLEKMGYHHRSGAWRHKTRSAIFVGDLIDRGAHQVRTLEIARRMVDAGSARATMGNHEFNAIAWATADQTRAGDYLRTRHGEKGKKNRHQHRAFLSDVGEDTPVHREWIAWMTELPLWIEEPEFRVVHACWSPRHVEVLRPTLRDGVRLTPALVDLASRRGSGAYVAGVTAGAMLITRFEFGTRLVGSIVLVGSLLAMAPPAYADQTLMASDNARIDCIASSRDLTRISLVGDEIASVSKLQTGNASEDFSVVNEPVRGDIYVSVPEGFSPKGTSKNGDFDRFEALKPAEKRHLILGKFDFSRCPQDTVVFCHV